MKIKRKFSLALFNRKEVVLSEAEASWLRIILGELSFVEMQQMGLTDLQVAHVQKWYDKLESL